MSKALQLNSKNFEEKTKGKVALLDFWAEWCAPCKMMLPVLDQIADEFGDRALIAKINVDEEQSLAAKFSIRSIPAFFVLKDGNIVWQAVGVQSKSAIASALENALKES